MSPSQPSIYSRGFLALCVVNLLAVTAFYLLVPVLPVYLLNDLHAGKTATGVLLSLYVVSALISRPFSGFLVDSLPRKPVFLACALAFAALFPAYTCITGLVLFGVLRALHGLSFGIFGTSISTLVVDLVPPERLGTGIGIFSLTIALSMALGPMLGLLLYEYFGPMAVFLAALGMAALCALLGLLVPATRAPRVTRPAGVPADSFAAHLFLPKSGCAALSIACASLCYGLILNYVSVFVLECGLEVNAGFYFCIMAVGMIITRMFTGRFIDSGKLLPVLLSGMILILIATAMLSLWPGLTGFFCSAACMGLGIGVITPASQTLFVDLARPDQRGTANSSFFIAWDSGITISLFAGGFAAELLSFNTVFLCGAGVLACAALFFVTVVSRAYKRDTRRTFRRE